MSRRWRVATSVVEGGVSVAVLPTNYGEPGSFDRRLASWLIEPPCWLGRLFGATMQGYVTAAQARAERICAAWNAEQRAAEEAVSDGE